MKLSNIFPSLLLVAAVVSQTACDDQTGTSCKSDLDCKGERICVERRCYFSDEAWPSDDSYGQPDSGTTPRDAGARDSSVLSSRDGGSRDAGAEAGASIEGLVKVPVSAQAIVGDAVRNRIYATVSGGDAMYANRLVTIDVATASVAHSVGIGSEPTSLAISDDGSTLWVGLSQAFAVRQVDLTGAEPVPGKQYALPPAQFGDLAAAGPMVVLPGSKASLAISLHREDVSPSFAGALIVDDGVARKKMTSGHTGASRLTLGPAGYLFGYNNLHTGYGFYAITIADDGLTQTEHSDLINGFATDIVYGYGYVYATSGEVIDVSNPAMPVRAGKFPNSGALVPLPNDKVLMASVGSSSSGYPSGSGALTFRLFDTKSFTQIDSDTGPNVSAMRNLLLLAPRTLAFVAAAPDQGGFGGDAPGAVYLVRNLELIP